MNITLAKTAGFCFGVDRAITTVYDCLKKYRMSIFTYGPIIHNEEVNKDLEEKGVRIINELDDIDQIKDGILILRSHGVPPEVYDKIRSNNILSIDMTCPYVKKIHKIVKEHADNGYQILIIGDETHPEVMGINGWSGYNAIIVNSINECYNIEKLEKVCIVTQTTFDINEWEQMKNFLVHNKCNECVEFNTICNATSERQRETESLAKVSDAIIVVGSKNSSNTQKLFSICNQYCKHCFFIQNADELKLEEISKFQKISITAGASAPKWIIDEVISKINNINKSMKIEAPIVKSIEPKIEESVQENELIENIEVIKEVVKNKNEEEKIELTKESGHDEKEENNDNNDFGLALEKSLMKVSYGDIVNGEIVGINEDEIIIDFGYKCDGIIPKDELVEDEPALKIGERINAVVIKVSGDGNIVLSKKQVDIEKAWERAKSAFESKTICLVRVLKEVRGGLLALFEGLKVFIPLSHLSDKYIEDVSSFVGNVIPVKIIEFNEETQNIVASSKVVLEENKQKVKNNFWDTVYVGREFEGKVLKVTSYGAIVDIGEVNGLLHVTEILPTKSDELEKYINVDDQILVYVKEFDASSQRIHLGLKNKPDSPWDNILNKYTMGDVVTCTVTKFTNFGAFVQLEPGIEGLVHISQISDKRLFKPEDVLELEQTVKAKITNLEADSKRLGLSIKDVSPINEKGESNIDLHKNEDDMIINNEDIGVTISDAIKIKSWNK